VYNTALAKISLLTLAKANYLFAVNPLAEANGNEEIILF
jgi:hypothetical protein